MTIEIQKETYRPCFVDGRKALFHRWTAYNSGMDYAVRRGDKISQVVVVKIDTPELVLVDKLADTERGNGGFGSTGR